MTKLNLHSTPRLLKEKGVGIFSPYDVARVCNVSYNTARHFIIRAKERGLITKLRNGLYVLNDAMPHEYVIANNVYVPSYISLETALSYQNILPEMVYAITSVTTKATREFDVCNQIYSYTTIKKEAFTGYIPVAFHTDKAFVATAEKALVDYMYFVALGKKQFNDRLRYNHLDREKIETYSQLFNMSALEKHIQSLW